MNASQFYVYVLHQFRMEITFSLLAQTVIACLLVTVAVVCYVYGDEDSGGGDTEADREAGD